MEKVQSNASRVAKIIKSELIAEGIKVKVKSSNRGGCSSVRVSVYDKTWDEVRQLEKDYSQYQYNGFNQEADCYCVTNSREDIPQVGYVSFYEAA